jgi:hypothetical protein
MSCSLWSQSLSLALFERCQKVIDIKTSPLRRVSIFGFGRGATFFLIYLIYKMVFLKQVQIQAFEPIYMNLHSPIYMTKWVHIYFQYNNQ